MRGIVELLKRFRADERGVFAVIFGLLAIVLVAMAGAAVDYTSLETARNKVQIALDSAALGLQPKILAKVPPSETDLKDQATALIVERLNDTRLTAAATAATFNVGSGTLRLEATVTVPMAFVQLVGIRTITAQVVSEATRKRINLEVALVLDNSGSMDQQSRMINLKKAAKCAMNVLLNALDECTDAKVTAANSLDATESNIWIGIVPFTGFVNVGPANKTATWMDKTGLSSIANHNFDDDNNDATPYLGVVNRFQLYTTMNVAWRGCVEARPYPYDTDDTVPDSTKPDTLFVPEFAPDNPDSPETRIVSGWDKKVFPVNAPVAYTNTYKTDIVSTPAACDYKQAGTWVQTQTKANCTSDYTSGDNTDAKKVTRFDNCSSSVSNTQTATNWNGGSQVAAATMPATQLDKNNNTNTPTCYYSSFSSAKSGTKFNLTRVLTCKYLMSDREAQERICKYTSGYSGGSPNQDCPTNALTPLTTTKKTVLDAINAMSSQGYTNIHQGAIWGYHMLSPTEPLTEAKTYDEGTSKVMIIMTDGENTIDTYGFGAGKTKTYQAYGFPINGRIFSTAYPNPSSDAEITAAMDSRTLDTCTNAKLDDKITIYTIGLSAPNQKTIDLLTDCASDPAKAYFPTDSSKLTAVFKDIADQLSDLRLSQ